MLFVRRKLIQHVLERSFPPPDRARGKELVRIDSDDQVGRILGQNRTCRWQGRFGGPGSQLARRVWILVCLDIPMLSGRHWRKDLDLLDSSNFLA